ncbi:MAG: guanylate kinase [Muribaculaceae bacterium]|nr:guanylate kinase [Muribaculaceae bacterium]MDD6019225.1 guanylate kinase [bacterium]MDD6025238.1 guanylate kinase [bacterium]
MANNGKLIIISAPSGTGKSTIIGRIIDDPALRLEFSISATTRSPREGEVNGVHYHFLSVEEFKDAIANDGLVEYEEVYPGRFYGTLKSEIARIQEKGNNAILDIDVKGGVNVKRMYGDNARSIFIMPPSIETLRQRLLSRATDSIEAINQRVDKAAFELTFSDKFDKQVVNDDLDKAVEETRQLILDFIKQP